ncbi:MAG TPA: GGDEF domain-containing protein [Mobilitalea sp.]|nr:GGDEF domain-containing protein [Mobilitalea sp.]
MGQFIYGLWCDYGIGGMYVLGNSKKTIGAFISQVNEEYQDSVSKGIITKAKELDYNVAFFTNFGGFGQVTYDMGEAFITELPSYEELEGIIITPDIMILPNLLEQYKRNIKSRCHCPVVSIRTETDEFYNVLVDDYTVLDDIITHFIEQHSFTRINFLAGPKGIPASDRRLASYRKILTEHHIPVEEERIYYGDLWRNAGNVAVDQWLNSDLERPQAIVCANDYMAITVCRALAERGIKVPDQIAVSGCDDVEDAAEFSPSLTTARMPGFEMGCEAVAKIHKLNQGIEQPHNTFIQTLSIYRSSCGCKRHWYHESNDRRRNHILARENLLGELSRNSYMSTDLTGLTRLEDVIDKLWAYIYDNQNLTHFCMCLMRDWDNFHQQEDEEHWNDFNDLLMEAGIKNWNRYTKVKCSKKELIPLEFAEEGPVVYFFTLLHHQAHCFGYVGISFNKVQTYMKTFQAWLITLSNVLENVRIHGELNRLIFKLEDMSIRDELTDLYNRRVLETLGKKYLKHCVEEQTKLMIFTADMDKLKYINDKFGHAHGDIALKVVANSLVSAADDDEICIRLGGDEFMAMGIDYDDAKMGKFVNRFVEELNKFNFLNEYDFSVYVSYGYQLILPDEHTTIERCLVAADTQMYQQKYEKDAKHIKANLVC